MMQKSKRSDVHRVGDRVLASINGDQAPGTIRAAFINAEGYRYYVVELEYYSFERHRIVSPDLLRRRPASIAEEP